MVTRMPIDPRVDFAFKCLFGSEANKSILISLLRAVLKLDIREVELLNPFNAMEAPTTSFPSWTSRPGSAMAR